MQSKILIPSVSNLFSSLNWFSLGDPSKVQESVGKTVVSGCSRHYAYYLRETDYSYQESINMHTFIGNFALQNSPVNRMRNHPSNFISTHKVFFCSCCILKQVRNKICSPSSSFLFLRFFTWLGDIRWGILHVKNPKPEKLSQACIIALAQLWHMSSYKWSYWRAILNLLNVRTMGHGHVQMHHLKKWPDLEHKD